MNWRVASGLAAAAALALAGCGIPRDSVPREIPRDAQQPLGGAGTPEAPGSAFGPRVYFLRDDTEGGGVTLVPVNRDVSATAEGVIGALLDGLTTEQQRAGLRTSVPSGTLLNSARVVAVRTLQVDVSEELFQAAGEAQIEAVAQLVYTSTALRGVDRVRLLVDGSPRDWLVGDGSVVSGPLTRFMYPAFADSSRPAFPPMPG